MAEHGETAGEYIQHHLTNLQVCRVNDAWVWNSAEHPEACKGNFYAVNVDSMGLSIILGVVFAYLFRRVAKSFTKGRPGKLQAGAEWVITFVESSVSSTFHGKRSDLIAPLALTILAWIFLMNTMDLIPVDWLPLVAGSAGVPFLKVVPTTDVNITFGMSISVFLLTIFYSIKIKGAIGFGKEFTFHPIHPPTKGIALIGAPFVIAFNLVLELVSFLSKPLSLSLRLFGNIFGEDLVILILFSIIPFLVPLPMMFLGLITASLQAFIFVLLTTIYLGGAVASEHEQHEHGAMAAGEV
jgi:F-type H+-transporting ATPase subunit a